jgi:hypothetical protein
VQRQTPQRKAKKEMKLNTTDNLSEGDRKAIVDHFAKEVVNITLKNTNGDYNLTKSIFFKAASYVQKQIREIENENLD